MKLFVHICCAPCYIYVRNRLEVKGFTQVGFWYNPNIHPYMEYRARLESLQKYSKLTNCEIIYKDIYDLERFLKGLINAEDRCIYCYTERLNETAKTAKSNGFDGFTTTLLISKRQQHEKIKEISEKIAEKIKIKFYYEDFREFENIGRRESVVFGLYQQKYCGCIFSEKHRFYKEA